MSVLQFIIVMILLFNLVFLFFFVRDLWRNRSTFMKEPGSALLQGLSTGVVFFLSSFGISDFAISMVIYTKAKWVPVVKMPGTLNTQCVIPVCAMALIYLHDIQVDIRTLFVCIFTQIIGAYLGARLVVRLNPWIVKRLLVFSLTIAALVILAGKVGILPSGGDAMSIDGWKLWLLGALSLLYGALINIGIGSYTLTMATVYAMGMNPIEAFPIMMGSSAFAVPISGSKFIQHDRYSRKVTLMASTFGVIGVWIATHMVINLDVSILQWLVVVSLFYAALGLYIETRQSSKRRDIGMATAAMRFSPEERAALRDEFEKSRMK